MVSLNERLNNRDARHRRIHDPNDDVHQRRYLVLDLGMDRASHSYDRNLVASDFAD